MKKSINFWIKRFIIIGLLTSMITNIYTIFILDNSQLLFPLIATLLLLILYLIIEKIYKKYFKNISLIYYNIFALFLFASLILGEIYNFYYKFELWDNILHFSSGFLLALLLINVFYYLMSKYFKKPDSQIQIIIIIIISLLASLSFAVFWELYEFSIDYIFEKNMQKGLIINQGMALRQIAGYVNSSGRFIDPALVDTMSDLFSATIGSILAGLSYYFYTNKK